MEEKRIRGSLLHDVPAEKPQTDDLERPYDMVVARERTATGLALDHSVILRLAGLRVEIIAPADGVATDPEPSRTTLEP